MATIGLEIYHIFRIVSFKTNIFPSDVIETAKILNIRITNYGLGVPEKNISEGDHHRTEYIEVEAEDDIIKIEEDIAEDNRPGTFNSESCNGKRRETLKLRSGQMREAYIKVCGIFHGMCGDVLNNSYSLYYYHY